MPSPAKTELRRRMRAELARMTPAACAAASESIRTSIPSLPNWQAAHTIAAYAALPSEPDLRPFAWRSHHRVLLPRVTAHDITFYHVSSPEDLIPGSFGVLEPDPKKCPPADPASAAVIFVPGVAFTAEGARLGRGRGYYDRLLSVLPADIQRIGVCFSCQLVDTIPQEPHDEGVDLVLSSPA